MSSDARLGACATQPIAALLALASILDGGFHSDAAPRNGPAGIRDWAHPYDARAWRGCLIVHAVAVSRY